MNIIIRVYLGSSNNGGIMIRTVYNLLEIFEVTIGEILWNFIPVNDTTYMENEQGDIFFLNSGALYMALMFGMLIFLAFDKLALYKAKSIRLQLDNDRILLTNLECADS